MPGRPLPTWAARRRTAPWHATASSGRSAPGSSCAAMPRLPPVPTGRSTTRHAERTSSAKASIARLPQLPAQRIARRTWTAASPICRLSLVPTSWAEPRTSPRPARRCRAVWLRWAGAVSARPPEIATGSGSDQSLGDNRIGIVHRALTLDGVEAHFMVKYSITKT